MPSTNDVTERIRHWATETGGDQMQRLGYAAIEAISGRSAANDGDYNPAAHAPTSLVERAIQQLRRDGREKEWQVLRTHYLTPGLTESERLQRLRREGLAIGRTAYYIYLDAAHAYVSAALSFGGEPCAS